MASHPFLSVGFRPFYLGAALFACLSVPLWVVGYTTGTGISATFPAFDWHVHEMLFGFAPAVMVGFLLTAVRNWTGLPTLSAGGLAALFALWIAGRVGDLVAPGSILSALVDLSFLPIAACALALPLWRARNVRNSFVVGILLLLFLANMAFYGAGFGWLPAAARGVAQVTALNLIAVLMVIIGGRVIPAFSANAIESLQPKRWPALESLAVGLMVLIALVDLLMPLMMTRSALGHTGRPLRAGGVEITCFLTIHAAALARVFGPLLDPARSASWITASAVLWAIAFATFASGYASILTAPRRAQ